MDPSEVLGKILSYLFQILVVAGIFFWCLTVSLNYS